MALPRLCSWNGLMTDPTDACLQIVIVDDDEADADLAARALRSHWPNLECFWAPDEPSFRKGLAGHPDIILADYNVPGCSAPHALAILKSLSLDIPLIVLTGIAPEENVLECMNLGAADYLLKDRLARLPPAVEAALKSRNQVIATQVAQRDREMYREQYRSLFHEHPDLAFALDTQGNITEVNRAVERFLGRPADELQGLPFTRIPDPALCTGLQAALTLAAAGQTRRYPLQLRRHDGELRDFEVTNLPTIVEGRNIGVFGIAKDVTAERQMLAALTASELEQRRLAKLNGTIINALPANVALLDAEGTVFAVNEGWRSFGTTNGLRSEAAGVGTNYLQICERNTEGDQDAAIVAQGLRDVLSGAQRTFSMEYPCDAPSENRWFRMLAAPARVGESGGAVVMHLDISEQRRAEDKARVAASAFRHLADAVMVLDSGFRVLTVNRAFTSITGYQPHEVAAALITDLLVADRSADFLAAVTIVVSQKGSWKGEIEGRRKNGERYAALLSIGSVNRDGDRAGHFTAVISDLSTVRHFEQRITYLARHDALTGFLGRSALEEYLATLIAFEDVHQTPVAVMLVDIDHFRRINDSLGHTAGDRMMQAVASRIARVAGGEDRLFRLSSDEFVVLTSGVHAMDEAQRLAAEIRSSVAEPFQLDEQSLYLTASIGISCFPEDGRSCSDLLRAADAAAEISKQRGRNQVTVASRHYEQEAAARFALQNALPLALARKEFLLEYQPVVELRTGRIRSVEALVRWQHPQLGLLGPGQFIGLAEETGVIVQMGEWVTRTALVQVKAWQKAGWQDAMVAVNLSPRQFIEPGLAQRVFALLEETGVEPRRLRLEVTEGTVMSDPAAAEATLQQLAARGISIAVDDFGTGYSSLSYLKRFPLSCLKVDRCFVAGIPGSPQDESIVRSIVALGHSLGLRIVAEGVETAEQARFLKGLACEDGQGYLFSRPVSAAAVLDAVLGEPLLQRVR